MSSWPSSRKAKASESSESPTTPLLQPQALILHATSARTMLTLYYIHRSHALVWPLYPVSFLSDGISNEGAIWCQPTLETGRWARLSRPIVIRYCHSPLKYTWGIYMGAAATAQCDGRDTCKTKQDQNQLWEGGDTGVVLMLGHNARHKHAQTHRYRPTTPSSGIRGGI